MKSNFSNPVEAARHLLTVAWDGRLPVNPTKIANKIGIEVRPIFSDAYSGKATHENDNPVIEYNQNDTPSGKLFTISHEIGHHYLGHTEDKTHHFHELIDNDNNFNVSVNDDYERQANNFAMELLMPHSLVDFLIAKKNMTSLYDLANTFGVSTVAMKYRLKKLGWI